MKLIESNGLYAEIDGVETPILSPWSDSSNPISCTREMRGGWLYLGSYSKDDELLIDFVSIRGFRKIARWRVSRSGEYIDQSEFSSARNGIFGKHPSYTHTNSAYNLARYAKGSSNDLQIYCGIKYLLRDPVAATEYINSYRPTHGKTFQRAKLSDINMHAVVIFNHNYARNIPHLDQIYSDKFASATYVLPNVAPISPRCFAFPAGSYSYHTLIYYAIEKILQHNGVDEDGWYLFTQDDVYLNKNFTQDAVGRFFRQTRSHSSLYYKNALTESWDYDSDWVWNERVLTNLYRPKEFVSGNGYEGFEPLFQKEFLSSGVGDIFALRGAYLREFADVLGNYIGQNVFPEVSIPSALKALAMITETESGQFRGEYLWGEDRAKINLEYLRVFDTTDRLFLHPVKISLIKQYRNAGVEPANAGSVPSK